MFNNNNDDILVIPVIKTLMTTTYLNHFHLLISNISSPTPWATNFMNSIILKMLNYLFHNYIDI